MKVLTAMYTMKRGGAYDRFRLMVEALLERGCQVHCLSLTPVFVQQPSFHNHLVRSPFQREEGLFSKCWVVLSFPWYCVFWGWREKIDLFIAFGSIYAFMFGIPKLVMRKPLITLIRGDFTFGLKTQGCLTPLLRLSRWTEYLGLNFSDRIVTVNRTMQEEIIKRMKWKKTIDFRILSNDIPAIEKPSEEDVLRLRKSYGIPRDGKIIVTAGVLNRGKNIEMLIRVLSNLASQNVFLFVVGGGTTETDADYENFLKGMARGLGVNRQTHFTGWLEQKALWNLFCAADLFVSASLKEGMPNVLLEALGCDLPSMGSNIPGIRDVLHYDELMFDPLNDCLVTKKVMDYFSDQQFSEHVVKICQERKQLFMFDWKERVFQLVS